LTPWSASSSDFTLAVTTLSSISVPTVVPAEGVPMLAVEAIVLAAGARASSWRLPQADHHNGHGACKRQTLNKCYWVNFHKCLG
jgi:hypothetical protein